ncbi:hypothetical protein [Clostridium folliculivorans]|uniref:Uncharacterized protein n=1 Tax=Clostridium folliculivorans TaxID=2886038 RepID=A0A9W5Y4M6_9CLOT|nr:hypothetical protein [Clostridium folliculivorans]GKU26485.1 hypothetical protein CFOLD11_33120 [Clostridium folliculivorans]GKU29083.1 hypothetical protein CFB3_11890 [Clostridium folliculivorans]
MSENLTIEDLQNQVNELTDKVDKLNEIVRLLCKSKMPDPRYPYSHWLLYKGIDNKLKRKLGYVLNILEMRFRGEAVEIPEKTSFVDDDLKQALYVNQKPTFGEVCVVLKSLLGEKCPSDVDTSILLMSLLREGRHVDLSTHLLVDASKNTDYSAHNFSQFI